LKHKHEAKVDFDADFGSKYGITKGVLTNPSEGEVYAPTAMWLEAVDLVLQRLKDEGVDFSKIKGLSGAGMQHGTVFWSKEAESLLASLDADKTLLEQLSNEQKSAFAHPHSPNWQDASTQQQCDKFDVELKDPETLAEVTGSKAHHVRIPCPNGKMSHADSPSSDSAVLKSCVSSPSTRSTMPMSRESPWSHHSLLQYSWARWLPSTLATSPA
jgi:hypothetical protein